VAVAANWGNREELIAAALVRADDDWLSEAYCSYAPDRLIGCIFKLDRSGAGLAALP